jgi:hypothetical protein
MAMTLTSTNIVSNVQQYIADVDRTTIPSLPTTDPIAFFGALKRTALANGIYQGKSIFEVANRTLSDLIVLGLAERLLSSSHTGYPAPATKVRVLLGTKDDGNDVEATFPDGTLLHGECFNVAPSFFQTKLNKTRKKLREARGAIKVIAFNDDAVPSSWAPKPGTFVYERIDVQAFLARHRLTLTKSVLLRIAKP